MKTLFDTSVIIAALVEAHPMHQRTSKLKQMILN